jgi:hypothetical protein
LLLLYPFWWIVGTILAPFWHQLGTMWAHIGIRETFRPSWVKLHRILAPFGVHLGTLGDLFGSIWDHLGFIFCRCFHICFSMFVSIVFGPFWLHWWFHLEVFSIPKRPLPFSWNHTFSLGKTDNSEDSVITFPFYTRQ